VNDLLFFKKKTRNASKRLLQFICNVFSFIFYVNEFYLHSAFMKHKNCLLLEMRIDL